MDINISYEIEKLVQYGLHKGLIEDSDSVYTRNRLLEVLRLDEFEDVNIVKEELESPEPILENIIKWAVIQGRLEGESTTYRDLFDTKIMACLIPRPSEVIAKFNNFYKESRIKATDYYYNLSKSSNYVRMDRVKKDLRWTTSTEYGDLVITINMAKPEKDPKDIAAERKMVSSKYPKCLLCKENEGYAGRFNHPARQNHRIIPVNLNHEKWHLQYSPYVYYNEHCIVFKDEHEPMKISKKTFKRLLDFVNYLPHYFIGSNADLPIVGGSILSHDHFQGGRFEFPMAMAEVEERRIFGKFQGVTMGKVKWPMSVIRLEGTDINMLVEASQYVFDKWLNFSDEDINIIAYTNGTPHNTITPIARFREGNYQVDLVLRNNRTSAEHPDGIFHPHNELHHIKKENIGLIEVMGLAVLPSRLNNELKRIGRYLTDKDRINEIDREDDLIKHKQWCIELLNKYSEIDEESIDEIIRFEVGIKFLRVLEHAGVFKRDEKGKKAFGDFMESL
jgi:UDPglucose--hexose-1-phosphate uridylyltransferase